MFRGSVVVLVLFRVGVVAGAEPVEPVSFRNQVAPILVKACLGCHHAKKSEGGLNMATFATLRRGGKSGGELILEPGDPDSSQLIELIRPGAAPRMPYKQPPLSADQIALLERWVKQGARFDGESETETSIASLVDPLEVLPQITPELKVAEAVTSLAYSRDGKRLAGVAGRTVRLLEAETGVVEATLGPHPGLVTTVRISPDGRLLVAAGGRAGMFGDFAVWDLETKVRRAEVRGHTDSVLDAAISADGRLLATASYDRQVKLWNLEDGKEVRVLSEHTDAVYGVAFAPDNLRLASAGADRTVKLWEVHTGRRLRSFSDSTAELYSVAFGADGRTVLAGGVDRSIHVWATGEKDATQLHSVFGHDAAILKLVISTDGKTLVSCGEDRVVKVWDLANLTTRRALGEQSDWPQGVALHPTGTRVAVGRYDGSISVYETDTGRLLSSWNPPAEPAAGTLPKPELVRNASLNPPSPRGATRGSTVKLTLTGHWVGHATAVVFRDPGLKGAIVRPAQPNPDRLEVDLTVEPEARPGVHQIGVITPRGVPPFQPFAVSEFPEVAAPDSKAEVAGSRPISLPATLTGTINSPGDGNHFRFPARSGERLIFECQARSLGSPLRAVLTLVDAEGRLLGEATSRDGAADPILDVLVPGDGIVTLRVTDADYGGTPGHFYRLVAGPVPTLTAVFPLGVERGRRASITLAGANLQGLTQVPLIIESNAEVGSIRPVPVVCADGKRPSQGRRVVVGEGSQVIESAKNDQPDRADPISVPGGVSGRIETAGDVDHFRFEARKGERLTLEVFGRRLGTQIDPAIEVLDESGASVARAVLRPLDQTEVAFREHDSTKPGIRLTRWGQLAVGDYVLIGRELARIYALPRNPDDDCLFWSERNQRLGFLGTTPEHHPMSQPIYKVSIHPPGSRFPPGGVSPVTLMYRNDDGGPATSKDSRLDFDPPGDGNYLVRVEDVRGQGGDDFGYHLLVHRARPRFRLAVEPENPNVPRGGTTLVTARISRLEGFNQAVDVTVEGLPPGVTATAARIEADDLSASLALSAAPTASAYSPPTWRIVGRAVAASGTAPTSDQGEQRDQVQVVDPGGSEAGWIVVSPAPNLKVEATPKRLVIRPGQEVSLALTVSRGPAFAGRVPIEIRNLPQGVRVLNIGLNGVLITETQTSRTVSLYAEPWVVPTERPFYAVGKAESAGTEHSSTPIALIVRPADDVADANANADAEESLQGRTSISASTMNSPR